MAGRAVGRWSPGVGDPHREAVYAAERTLERALDAAGAGDTLVEVLGQRMVIENGERHFSAVAHLETYLRWLAASPVAVGLRPDGAPPAVVIDGRRRDACLEAGTVRLPDSRFGRRELTVLHEMAHHLAAEVPPHGPAFTGVLIALVRHAIGPTAGLLLTEQLSLRAVPVTYVS